METITVQKQVFENFIFDFEKLLVDYEKILDTALTIESEKRLSEAKTSQVQMLNENDYKKFMKAKGVKNV
ncbi:MAG: hypothetical protein AABX38_02820 [Candidatus Micrarchaeota archaeon]